MRVDELGLPCPETLGEYYDINVAILGKDSPAVKYLLDKINASTRDAKVTYSDSRMRDLILTLHGRKNFENLVLNKENPKESPR